MNTFGPDFCVDIILFILFISIGERKIDFNKGLKMTGMINLLSLT
jgi:hypothetical protein